MGFDPGAMLVSLAECKAYLRLERDDEDALLTGFVRTAAALCEAFTGQWLLVRTGEQRLAAETGWQRLAVQPLVMVMTVSNGNGDLPVTEYETDIDVSGTGWVRLVNASPGLTARFQAGLGADWNAVPEPLRQGVIRLVAHLYTHRDAADAGPPPAAVAAMWRPWRRMRLA